MVRLSQQVKLGPKSTKSFFFFILLVRCSMCFTCFRHRKANLIKHDLGRLGRFFSGQFEEPAGPVLPRGEEVPL